MNESRIRQLLKSRELTKPVAVKSARPMTASPAHAAREGKSPVKDPSIEVKPKSGASGYAINDPDVGGKLVASWIRANFKHSDWSNVIADYTTAHWFTRSSLHKEARSVNEIPAGFAHLEVIRYRQSDAVRAELDCGFFHDAMRKWFVC